MTLMQSYTSFLDESSAAPALLQKFKTWFWSICGKLNSQEKQVWVLVTHFIAFNRRAVLFKCVSLHSQAKTQKIMK